MIILSKQQILDKFDADAITLLLKDGFIAFSQKQVQMPPVQHLLFEQANGDCCIKSGYLQGDKLFVVKVSSGFYHNPAQGLASNQGVMMAFSAQTGEPQALLLDEGWLTALRTALAGRIAAELCAPRNIRAIGIVGTGMQARLHLMYLKSVISCRQLWVWGRSETALEEYRQYAQAEGFDVNTTQNAAELARHCQLIVTTTPSREAILHAVDIQPGTHITAVGADGAGKHELAPDLVAKADKILVDSWEQCTEFGEISQAFQRGMLAHHSLTEIGVALAQNGPFRNNDQQITLADLTGLGIQDVQIVKGILE
ncbi:ornithine cyclodeaminase family protein [Yersinia vastinensis]|uniref:ornithine cyclodeaminase family protein n=1 Tax=Yersinia vastinensis TaxID=2890318 RepID=UPI0005E82925|nr:ornithine cyclodeaminase family protein [Yersinia vastinensis]OVZ96982.1 ornithine cyclodeaminase family protein [Yersinia frederiksenii]CNI40285.1 ornithine cyclodeaminase [Yersinia frederiksenii]CNI52570.1 ornithine cyclodeaminase [Yersinia frederiksenii]CNK31530.1 ornithine cyclodeaminase [Yersinia frederiksenii]